MKTKKCENYCPECGSDNINWGAIEILGDSEAWQKAICEDCNCNFHECYSYRETEWGY